MSEELKSNLTTAGNLLSSLIRYTGSVYLVIDGVDEINELERGKLAQELLRLVELCESLRLILSSRLEADLTRLLGDVPTAIQVHEHNKRSIETYVSQRSQEIYQARKVLPHAQIAIRTLLVPLASRAKGMFLFARIILDMVNTMHDLLEMERELAVLPEDLDSAYHRIIVRLGKQKDRRMVEQTRRLLGWIACSPSPLTIEEAHQALVVRPDDRNQVFNMVAKLDVVEFLGPIVETADGYIRFVHFTAKEYVTSSHLGAQLIDLNLATMDLAVRCIGYLCQQHHDPDMPPDERSKHVLTGQYSFHAFSTKMWFELVCQYLRSTKAAEPSIVLVRAIKRLWEIRKIQDLSKVDEDEIEGESRYNSEDEADFEALKRTQPLLYGLLCRISQFRNSYSLSTGKMSQDTQENGRDPLSTSDTSRLIRQTFDDILCGSPRARRTNADPECHERCNQILQLYGQRPFQCRVLQCKYWQHGFQTHAYRNTHEQSHDQPLKCDVSGCEFGLIGFLSEKLRQDHLQQAHRSSPPQPTFDTQNLTEDGVMPLLLNLVQEDQVEAVHTILSAFPDVLSAFPDGLSNVSSSRDTLLKLAGVAASSGMLKLFEVPTQLYAYRPIGYIVTDYIVESIKGCNQSTFRHFLPQTADAPDQAKSLREHYEMIIFQLVSSGWSEGMEIWVNWIQSHMDTFRARLRLRPKSAMEVAFGSKRVLRASRKHLAGELQLLYLWRESGLVPLFTNDWPSQTLRNVADICCSIPLAAFLLKQGADVNAQHDPKQLTALQRVAKQTSIEGAKMMEFLLLNGADPELNKAEQEIDKGKFGILLVPAQKIRDEKGAKNIQKWLRKTWDELVEETKQIRNTKRQEKR